MRVLVGGLIFGLILYFVPGLHSGPACLVTGWLSALILEWTAPRSHAEKVGLLLAVAFIAWIAGPRAASGQSLLWHLGGWGAASGALSYYLHPKSA